MDKKIKIHKSWYKVLEKEFEQGYFRKIRSNLFKEMESYRICPRPKDIFRAFDMTPFNKVKVLILGQDPYINGEADGLAFSVDDDHNIPPTLGNIYREIDMDLKGHRVAHITTELDNWAEQGVFLLNSILTTRRGYSGAHKDFGWQRFTDTVISELSTRSEGIVFMLWGNFAREKALLIDHKKHLVLEAAHPSPLSVHRGFSGCRHFSKANAYLKKCKKKEIKWRK